MQQISLILHTGTKVQFWSEIELLMTACPITTLNFRAESSHFDKKSIDGQKVEFCYSVCCLMLSLLHDFSSVSSVRLMSSKLRNARCTTQKVIENP